MPDVGYWDTGRVPGHRARSWASPTPPASPPTRCCCGWRRSCCSPSGTRPTAPTCSPRCWSRVPPRCVAIAVVQLTRKPVLGLVAGIALAVGAHRAGATRCAPTRTPCTSSWRRCCWCCCWPGSERERCGPSTSRPLAARGLGRLRRSSLGNHALTLLLAPGVAVYVLLVVTDASCGGSGGWCSAACWRWSSPRSLVYAYIPLRSSMDPPLDYAHPPTHLGGASSTSCWASSSRAPSSQLPSLPTGVAHGRGSELMDNLGPGGAGWPLLGVLARRRPPLPRLVLTALWFAADLHVRAGLPERRHRALLPGAASWSRSSGRRWRSTPLWDGLRWLLGPARPGRARRAGRAARRRAGHGGRRRARSPCWLPVLAPVPDALRRRRRLDGHQRARLAGRHPGGARAGRGDRQLVELLDAAVVRALGGGPAAGRHHHRRPRPSSTRASATCRRVVDQLPREAAGLPRAPRRRPGRVRGGVRARAGARHPAGATASIAWSAALARAGATDGRV